MSLFSFFQNRFSPQNTSSYQATGGALARLGKTGIHDERHLQYARHLRAYQGYSIRGDLGSMRASQYRRVKFNFVQPVVNLSAGWFAAKPLTWDIDNDPEATAAAHAIWDRSGSDRALLENALCCGIYGDLVGIATQTLSQSGKRQSRIEFVEPGIATPTFDGADYSRLTTLEIAYEATDTFGRVVTRREMFGERGLEVFVGDAQIGEESVAYDHLPCVWIRNSSVKGLPFGLSDVEPILELVEEYDHVASKQTRIVDTYASPSIVFRGIQRSDLDKDIRTTIFLPKDADAKFLEWSGSGPDVEKQLTRIRNAIAEISQVPAVAFGQADSGLTSISGVAIQILYGPLLSKTHRKQANWGPALEYLMWRCLVAEGFAGLTVEQVNTRFPSATPVDGQALVAEASAKVAADIASRRTVMDDLGIEDPNAEFKRILFEKKLLQLVDPVAVQDQNANTAAKAGAKGAFAAEVPPGVGQNQQAPPVPAGPAMPSPAPPTLADQTSTNDDEIAHFVERIDALLEAENLSVQEAEQPAADRNKV